MEFHIRQETPADHDAVYALHQAAFEQNAEAKLVELLRNSDAFVPQLSLVAESDGTMLGHILFTKSASEVMMERSIRRWRWRPWLFCPNGSGRALALQW